MSKFISEERQEELRQAMDIVLKLLRQTKKEVIVIADESVGTPHSHGEVDNSKGLALRALSKSVTEAEDASMWMIRSFFTDQGEYTPLQKLKKA